MKDEIKNDPDLKKYLALTEKVEFYRERQDLTEEGKNKYLNILNEQMQHLDNFNKRWFFKLFDTEEKQNQVISDIRNELAAAGLEVTVEQLKKFYHK